jgi:hypothetical protein
MKVLYVLPQCSLRVLSSKCLATMHMQHIYSWLELVTSSLRCIDPGTAQSAA